MVQIIVLAAVAFFLFWRLKSVLGSRQGFEKSHPQGIESRRPILSFVRSIPVAGNPAEVVEIMDSGRKWLEKSSKSIPVLFFSVQPGTMMPEDRDFIRGAQRMNKYVCVCV